MIVCVCNAIDEDELRSAARSGAPCPRSAFAHLGCEAQCGACLIYAQEIIDDEHGAERAGTNVVKLRTAA